ncbi:hypothetical protein [Streptomyces sp. NPDC001657]|uniref:hypothetical protein n=1 Tax=Streptomyces sp. NPDC001657 TaxID=3154522 RepID=UPI00332C47B6
MHVRSFAQVLTERQGERLPQGLAAVRQDDLPSLHTLAAGIERDRHAVTSTKRPNARRASPKENSPQCTKVKKQAQCLFLKVPRSVAVCVSQLPVRVLDRWNLFLLEASMSDLYSPIPELNLLKEFQDRLGGRFFSDGFELFDYDDDLDWFCGSADPEYLDRLIPFAYATGSGSYYALWRCDDRADLATLPVIFFGDEGACRVEARDLRELFRLLACPPEEEDLERLNPGHQEYVTWLGQNFGLTAPDHPDDVVEPAMGEYFQQFANWVRLATRGTIDVAG